MVWAIAADVVVVVHLAFIVFVVLGGFLLWRWPALVWAHVPCAVYGVLIELVGWTCPLTPLENACRAAAGEVGYEGGFIDHYLLPIIYPSWWSASTAVVLAAGVVVANVVAYGGWWRRRR